MEPEYHLHLSHEGNPLHDCIIKSQQQKVYTAIESLNKSFIHMVDNDIKNNDVTMIWYEDGASQGTVNKDSTKWYIQLWLYHYIPTLSTLTMKHNYMSYSSKILPEKEFPSKISSPILFTSEILKLAICNKTLEKERGQKVKRQHKQTHSLAWKENSSHCRAPHSICSKAEIGGLFIAKGKEGQWFTKIWDNNHLILHVKWLKWQNEN